RSWTCEAPGRNAVRTCRRHVARGLGRRLRLVPRRSGSVLVPAAQAARRRVDTMTVRLCMARLLSCPQIQIHGYTEHAREWTRMHPDITLDLPIAPDRGTWGAVSPPRRRPAG